MFDHDHISQFFVQKHPKRLDSPNGKYPEKKTHDRCNDKTVCRQHFSWNFTVLGLILRKKLSHERWFKFKTSHTCTTQNHTYCQNGYRNGTPDRLLETGMSDIAKCSGL